MQGSTNSYSLNFASIETFWKPKPGVLQILARYTCIFDAVKPMFTVIAITNGLAHNSASLLLCYANELALRSLLLDF